jgi:DnaJ homolog subfamily A member 2
MPGYKLYDALGLQRHASTDDIKKAYRKLAVINHPDKGGDAEKFKVISAAYDILGDPEKKQEYDVFGDEGKQAGPPQGDFSQFFSGFQFSQNNNQRPNQEHDFHIPLREAFFGCKKIIKICLDKKCFTCQQTCPKCKGQGHVILMIQMGVFTQHIQQPCDMCQGNGCVFDPKPSCSTCQGKGSYKEEKDVDVLIYKGFPSSGKTITINGYGPQAQKPSEKPGNLIIKIIIDDDINFKRRDDDLIFEQTISLFESITGTDIKVPHFVDTFVVNTRQFGIIEPGEQYIVKTRGMPNEKNDTFGNLILKFKIKYPKVSFTDEQYLTLEDVFKKCV